LGALHPNGSARIASKDSPMTLASDNQKLVTATIFGTLVAVTATVASANETAGAGIPGAAGQLLQLALSRPPVLWLILAGSRMSA